MAIISRSELQKLGIPPKCSESEVESMIIRHMQFCSTYFAPIEPNHVGRSGRTCRHVMSDNLSRSFGCHAVDRPLHYGNHHYDHGDHCH